MKLMKPLAVVCCLIGLLAVVETGRTDDAKTDAASKKKAAKKAKPKNRLPFFYGQLGLSSEQREKVYGVQNKYRPQIAELVKKLKDLKEQRKLEYEGVLTDKQKKKLTEFQEFARKNRKRSSRKFRFKLRGNKTPKKAKENNDK